MEKLVNLYVFETKAAFDTALPALKELSKMAAPYKAEGKYASVQAQATIWATTPAEAVEVKKALGDCDYYTFPKSDGIKDKAGFVDFKNADGGTGKP